MSTTKKAGISAALIIMIGSMVGLGTWIGEKSYAPLYTNLQPDQSIALVKILQEENISYLVSKDGTTISVPPELVQPTLMKLAVKGTPGGAKPGMELFDKESFGTSSYVQRINYIRALQGELARTISTLKSVKHAAVHISLPPKSGFMEESEDPKASVVIESYPGMRLAKEEVRGVQELVAASIERLRAERVAIVDHTGVALSRPGDGMSALSTSMLEHQRRIEQQLESRIEDLLSRIVGHGKAVARVNAELDFDPLKEKETVYDPEQSAISSQDKQENNMQGSRPVASGAAGAQGALPGPASAAPEARQAVSKTDERTKFEVSTKVRDKEKALGSIKRLTVAVLVAAEQSKGADGKLVPVPLSDEKRASIDKLVRDSIGFVSGRDSVSIESSPFAEEDMDKADQFFTQRQRRLLIFSLIRYGTVALFILLFFTVVVRPFVRWLTGISVAKVETVLPKTVEELEIMQEPSSASLPGMASLPLLEETVDLEKAEGELLREKIISMVDTAPPKAAQIIGEWMAEGGDEKKQKGKRR